jgi:hypothetical protein
MLQQPLILISSGCLVARQELSLVAFSLRQRAKLVVQQRGEGQVSQRHLRSGSGVSGSQRQLRQLFRLRAVVFNFSSQSPALPHYHSAATCRVYPGAAEGAAC